MGGHLLVWTGDALDPAPPLNLALLWSGAGPKVKWAESYLRQRQQCVSHQGDHSETMTIQFGVPTHVRCRQIRPCDTASGGLTLAAGARTYPGQAVCAGVRLHERNSTGILVWPNSVCRQYRTSSAPFSVNLRFLGSTNSSRIHWRPCVCCGRSTSVEQSTASPPLNLQIVVFIHKRT